MSRSRILPVLTVIALAAVPQPASADVTRTLKLEFAPSGAFAVENLAGTMRVVAGKGDKVLVVATIHAESDEMADLMKLEQVEGTDGVPTLRVVYPLDKYTNYKFAPAAGGGGDAESESWFSSWFSGWHGGSNTSTKYAGRQVRVSNGKGVDLYADVEVQLPGRAVTGHFRNVVGRMHGESVGGTLEFDTGSGDITLVRLTGTIEADTGSGDVKASEIDGSFSCNTGSGDCDVSAVQGDVINCDTGSGDIRVSKTTARLIDLDTGSGDVSVVDSDMEEFKADTGSGDISLECGGSRLVRAAADTGSGDVTMIIPPSATFEATADQGSGEIYNRFSDAQPILRDKEVVGYRRGDARIRIKVATGSGDFRIEPAAGAVR